MATTTTTSMTIGKWKQMIWNGRYVKHLYCAPREGNKLWYCGTVKDIDHLHICEYCASLYNTEIRMLPVITDEEKAWFLLAD